MGGTILVWLVAGGVLIAIAGGVGYALATFNYLKVASEAARNREELQKLLAAAESRAALTQSGKAGTAVEPAASAPSTTPSAPTQADNPPPPPNPSSGYLSTSSDQAVPGDMLDETAEQTPDVQCIVDIDHLRAVAERHGEDFAAYVGKHVEQVLRDTLSEFSPLISRYEGQEFILAWDLPPGSEKERLRSARETAEAMRSAVERAFLQVGSERVTVTISLGLALCEDEIAGEQLLAQADEALAAAKKAGRNCGYFYKPDKCAPVDLKHDSEATILPEQYASSSGRSLTQIIAEKKLGHRDRRRHERKPCSTVNLIAPCYDAELPSMDKFQRVQFFDISSSGFSMIVSAVPPTDRFAVALLNSQGMIFMAAEIANIRQASRPAGNGKPLLLVGCRFRQRLHPNTEPAVARRQLEAAAKIPAASKYQPQRV